MLAFPMRALWPRGAPRHPHPTHVSDLTRVVRRGSIDLGFVYRSVRNGPIPSQGTCHCWWSSRDPPSRSTIEFEFDAVLSLDQVARLHVDERRAPVGSAHEGVGRARFGDRQRIHIGEAVKVIPSTLRSPGHDGNSRTGSAPSKVTRAASTGSACWTRPCLGSLIVPRAHSSRQHHRELSLPESPALAFCVRRGERCAINRLSRSLRRHESREQ